MKRSYLVLALMLIGLARPALAQVQGGTVSGTVLDEQGAVLRSFVANRGRQVLLVPRGIFHRHAWST